MSFRIVSLAAVSALLLAAASGCMATPMELGDPGAQAGSAASESGDDVPTFSSPVAYLSVAPAASDSGDSAFMTSFRNSFANEIVVIDDHDAEHPSAMCTHSESDIPAKYEEMKTPRQLTCATAPSGTQGLPPGIDNTWSGYGSGGCGTWAVAMCNRILGDTPSSQAVSKEEWNGIAKGIKQNATGGSMTDDRSAYYKDKGYCVEDKRFDGTTADYEDMIKKRDDGCDIKLAFWKRLPNGTYVNGHVETVTGASLGGATTNSWGNQGIIEGGSKGGFKHSEDGKSFKDPATGGKLWPAGSTEVEVSYVCKCGVFESLAHAVMGN
jgi:hypothetical protein